MSLKIDAPEKKIAEIADFLRRTYQQQNKTQAIIAVSGGIDSALSLALLSQALPKEQITALFLPYGTQSTADAELISNTLNIPKENCYTINIAPIVDAATSLVLVSEENTVRRGNLMARARMMIVYDMAKEKDALVCGTENKSEHYLGYYTRFGDAASDIEPIVSLYKTQVRQLAEYLAFPEQFLTKSPSAGLWEDQTDESEMGFSYDVADQVMSQLVDQFRKPEEIKIEDVPQETINAVIEQIQKNRFKLHVPYVME
jgi:NAD+ synthase